MSAYLTHLNATKAYREAGYGGSQKSAGELGSRLLKKVRIAAAVKKGFAAIQARWEATKDRVVEETACLGFSDMRRIFNADGTLKKPTDLDDQTARAIASIEVLTRPNGRGEKVIEVHRIRFHDKTDALVLLCRHLGMLTGRVKHLGTDLIDETASDEELITQMEAIIAKSRARGASVVST